MSNTGERNEKQRTGIPQEWDAFCRFIDAHYGLIYSVSLAHTRDAEVAQEITQDVCVRLLLEQKKLSQVPNPSGWLVLVARNTAVDWGRRRQRHSRILAMMESWNHDTTKAGHAPADARTAAANEEEKQRLYAALEHIAPEDREIILMHYIDGVEKQEIARLLALHPSTVGRRMDKAMRQLKTELGSKELPSFANLRPAEHNSKSVLATLGAIAALTATDKAALAAAAAPLPILSTTAGTATTIGGSQASIAHKINAAVTNALPGWALPAVAGIILFGGAAAIMQPWNNKPKNQNTAPQIAALSRQTQSPTPVIKPHTRKTSSNPAGSRIMNGLTSLGANSPGFLYPSLDGKTLYGNVTNSLGETIAGAKVTLTYWKADTKAETSQTLITDAKGSFIFTDVVANVQLGMTTRGYLTATAPGYAHATHGEYKVSLPLPNVREDINIRLDRPVTHQGTVVNENGQPVVGAEVAVIYEYDLHKQMYQNSDFREEIFVTKTDPSGKYGFTELKPGHVALRIDHSDYGHIITDALPSATASNIVHIDKGVDVTGTVHDGETTMANTLVRINPIFIATRSGDDVTVRTDSNGRFSVRHLSLPDSDSPVWWYSLKAVELPQSPSYKLQLRRGESTRTVAMNTTDPRVRMVEDWPIVDVPENESNPNDEPLKDGLASIEGVISGGNMTSDTQTRLVGATSYRGSGVDMRREEPVHDGQFKVRNMKPGSYWISAYQKFKNSYVNLQPVKIELKENEQQSVAMRFGTAGIQGKIKGLAPGHTTCTVNVISADRESSWYVHSVLGYVASTITDVNGQFKIAGIPAGKYIVSTNEPPNIGTVAISCQAGQTAEIELPTMTPFSVRGIVIDASTSKPLANATVQAVPKIQLIRGRDQSVKTDFSGHFELMLTSGTYDLNIRANGKAWPSRMIVDVNGPTGIPALYVNQKVGGVVFHAVGNLDVIDWRQASFAFIDHLGNKTSTNVNSSERAVNMDRETHLVSNVSPGKYNVVVKYQNYGAGVSKPFSSVYIPDITVQPDFFTIVNVPVEPSSLINLECQPGVHHMIWSDPEFWVRDQSGVEMPIRLDNANKLSLGLAPGAYTFGVTLDSGEEQSIDFRVATTDEIRDVVLKLK